MAKVLYTSAVIRNKIIEIMEDDSCKRTVVVAFVGNSAEHYLSNPNGMKLICWPKPGSTNPYELNRLKNKGVELLFCDNLHMKIYHSEKHGTVLGSANLSTNAIGNGRLMLLEAGVYLKPAEFDLKKVLNQLNLRKPLKRDWNNLYEGLKVLYGLENPDVPKRTNSFNDWLKLPIEHKLKLAIYDGFGKFSKEELEFGPEYSIEGLKKYYKVGDTLLTINTNKNGELLPNSTTWQFVDRIISTVRLDFPYSALQDKPTNTYRFPFKLTPEFKIALAQECKKYGVNKLDGERHKYLSDAFLKRLSKQLS